MSRKFLATLLILIFTGCSSAPRSDEELPPSALDRLQGLETIVIMGINDVHGALAPIEWKSKALEPDSTPVKYERGGLAMLAGYIQVLRKEHGPRFLLLDAGDHFQGSIESNLEEGAPIVKAYNALGISAAAIGNHEFDFGAVGPEGSKGDPLGALKARMSEATYPYVVSNIVEKSSGKPPVLPHATSRLLLSAGSVKVGVIGLSTLETPVTTRPENVRQLFFTDLKDATLREAEALRAEGAQLVVISAHVGLKCDAGRAASTQAVRRATTAQGDCGDDDELVRLLRALPAGTVDAVVAGHSHQVVHHWVAGVPVIESGHRLQQFNLLYLTYDWNRKKLVTERTRIEGPVGVCPRVFSAQRDCNGDRPAPPGGRGDLVTPVFHGHKIRPDSAIEALLEPVFAKSAMEKARIIGEAARPIPFERNAESPMGNLVADGLRASAQSDIGLINAGGVRLPLEQGPITFGQIFQSLPFDNSVARLTLTGKELKLLLRITESGSRGYFPLSGVRVRLIDSGVDAPSSDLNLDGKIEPWEVNRLIDAKLDDGTSDGASIDERKSYRVALPDFLVAGGDDLGWFMTQLPAQRVEHDVAGLVRDELIRHIGERSPLNSETKPLVDSSRPRLTFEKLKVTASGKKGARKHRRKHRAK